MAASSDAVATAAVIAVVAAVIGFLGFQVLRSWSRSAILYDSKRHTPAVKHKPSALPNTCFGWVWATINYAESDVIRECGLDTAIYLRLLSFGTTLFSILTVWCIITVLPTNYTDSEVDILLSQTTEASSTYNYEFSGFDKLALTNVQPGSHRLWVHLISVYVVSYVTLKLLWKNSCDCVLLRLMWIGSQRPTPITHSVLVTDIPGVSDATRRTRAEWQRKQRNAKQAERESMRAGRPMRTTEEAAEEGLVYYTPSLSTSSTQQIMANTPPMSDLPIHSYEGPEGSSNGPAANSGEPIKRAGSHNAFLPPNFIQCEELRRLHRKQLQRFDLSDASLLDPVAVAKGALGPGHMDPQDFVQQEFSSVYSEEELKAINLVHDLSDLQPLYTEYSKLKEKLNDYIDECRHNQARGRAMKRRKALLCVPLYGTWGLRMYGTSTFKRVDMLGFYLARLRELERAILEEQGKVKTLVWPSAFVTFSSRVSQTVAATSLHHHDERTWRVQPAPPPDELVWGNLGLSRTQRRFNSMVQWSLFWLMTAFYFIPVGAVQGLIDAAKHPPDDAPGLQAFLHNVVIRKLLEAVVPGLALKIFLWLVPFILAAMMEKSGALSLAQVDLGVVTRFFLFQLIVVFFGAVLAGSFFSQAAQWVEHPETVISLLGTAIPQTTTFFITYMWVNTGWEPISFWRTMDLVSYFFLSMFARSPREKARLWQEQYTKYDKKVVSHTMFILLGVVYSCINPIIAPSALVYFIVRSLIERYENIFVYRRRYESGGQLWGRVFEQVMVGIYIFQLAMIGLLSVKHFPYSPLLLPCLVGTMVFHASTRTLMRRPYRVTSLHDAAVLDMHDKDVDIEEEGPRDQEPPSEFYLPPVLKIKPGDLGPLLQQAEQLDRELDGATPGPKN
mmetsp:Transcript_6024/g.16044  ORF Transcript_6024/g.16044 Transcript_6024/m.16044 type:complete len:898 (+) Transcript_6024:96-2789(+)|eukprot:CAMPEP_0202369784 /NCGR_PEP_ID=MMETSP1127-20130417/1550_1 /ASSEMBLY_ACC=CAM_ASM_000462 /TAXON_ID=3047 /ORGANISM="Dunaliella tertiolecta, Strain CCMP1320" /LENGTH=897 /DNA_ID=CAMNT_0048965545 /DNA_START=108 /DNA_END=2801 /DNA_ORIENTATION=-